MEAPSCILLIFTALEEGKDNLDISLDIVDLYMPALALSVTRLPGG